MVTVCAGCDAFRPWVAVMLGACGGSLYLVASLLLVKLKIDDPLDASAIHASCGNTEKKSIFQPQDTNFSLTCFLGLLGLLANPLVRNEGLLTTGSEEMMNMLLWNTIGAGTKMTLSNQNWPNNTVLSFFKTHTLA